MNNPTVRISGTLNGSTIQGLLTAIRETTGLKYGYMPQGMIDTQFFSFHLTLCGHGKRTLGKGNQRLVDATIRAWAIGFGLGNPSIAWPNCYEA